MLPVRSEIRDLTADQWNRVVKAMWKMKRTKTLDGRKTYGPNFHSYDIPAAEALEEPGGSPTARPAWESSARAGRSRGGGAPRGGGGRGQLAAPLAGAAVDVAVLLRKALAAAAPLQRQQLAQPRLMLYLQDLMLFEIRFNVSFNPCHSLVH